MTALFISLIGLLCHLQHTYAFSIQGRSRLIASYGGQLPVAMTNDDYQLEENFDMTQQLQQRRQFIQSIATAGIVSTTLTPLAVLAEDVETTIDPSISIPQITKKVYIDIKFANYKTPKRLVIGLFGNDMPITVDNFVKLCANNEGEGPSYAGSTFYRGKIQVFT